MKLGRATRWAVESNCGSEASCFVDMFLEGIAVHQAVNVWPKDINIGSIHYSTSWIDTMSCNVALHIFFTAFRSDFQTNPRAPAST